MIIQHYLFTNCILRAFKIFIFFAFLGSCNEPSTWDEIQFTTGEKSMKNILPGGKVFRDYKFENGEYSILGIYSHLNPGRNSLQDSIGEFYSDHLGTLNKLKESWIFSKPGIPYSCGYHYQILLCKRGLPVETFLVNLNCNIIVVRGEVFQFDNNKLSMFYHKVIPPKIITKKFEDITDARNYRDSCLTSSGLIYIPTPKWKEFEGGFSFEYKCNYVSDDCTDENKDKVIEKIRTEIRAFYPDENFELKETGGSSTTISYRINCNKSLYDEFDLFGSDPEFFPSRFETFPLYLKTYWKKL